MTSNVFEELRDDDKLPNLQRILSDRLPVSCFVLNQLKYYQERHGNFKVHTFTSRANANVSPEDSVWVLVTVKREDWGTIVSVSGPNACLLSDDVKDALGNSHFLDWHEPFVFLSQSETLTDFVVKRQIHVNGNITKIYPTHMFYMPVAEALKLEISPPPNVELKPLDVSKGLKFITSSWPHTRKGTKEYLERQLHTYYTGGVYPRGNDEPVSTAIFPDFGILSCLATHPDHRRKGYASLVTKYVYKMAAEKGYHPCLDTDISDKTAVGFHKSFTGNKIIGKLYYVCHKAM